MDWAFALDSTNFAAADQNSTACPGSNHIAPPCFLWKSKNSSKAAISLSVQAILDPDFRFSSGNVSFLRELNCIRAWTRLALGVCPLGDTTSLLVPRGGHTGLTLIVEKGVNRRSSLHAPPSAMAMWQGGVKDQVEWWSTTWEAEGWLVQVKCWLMF